MSYRMRELMSHKDAVAVVVSDVKSKAEYHLSGGCLQHPDNCDRRAALLLEARGRGSSHGIDGPLWHPGGERWQRYWKPIREKWRKAHA